MTKSQRPVAAVVGVGPGNGAACARKLAAEGYAVALLARSDEPSARLADELDGAAFRCDVTESAQIEDAFAAIADELGPVDTVVYNAGSGAWGAPLDTELADFERAWRINAHGALAVAHQVVPGMVERGRGNFVFIGATASLRGGANFTAFASAKAAQRSLAQSMARALWPKGIHVSLVIVDGMIESERARKMAEGRDVHFLQPDDIAHTVHHLVTQPSSAWSFQVETRPAREKW